MQEIVDRYTSSSASTAQSLPGRDNHLYAKIEFFARGRGHAFLMYSTPHHWLRNSHFVCHLSRDYGRNCFKSFQNSVFHFWRSCISRTSCIAVWDGKRTSFSQSSIYTGKGDLEYNEMETIVRTIFVLHVRFLLLHLMWGVYLSAPHTCTLPWHSRKVSDDVIEIIF